MKLRFYIILIATATIVNSCTKVDFTIPNIEEIIALKTRNINTYTYYENLALKDSAFAQANIIKTLILSEKIQLDSCYKIYSSLKKNITQKKQFTDSSTINFNTQENLYKILVDKQLEGYNILPSMIANPKSKSKKVKEFAPLLLKLINVNQLNATELLKILNDEKYNDSSYKINIITNF